MFKYDLGETVYYMKDNTIHIAPVLSRKYVDNKYDKDQRCTEQQEQAFAQFGNEGIQYATIHGTFNENHLFENETKLKESL